MVMSPRIKPVLSSAIPAVDSLKASDFLLHNHEFLRRQMNARTAAQLPIFSYNSFEGMLRKTIRNLFGEQRRRKLPYLDHTGRLFTAAWRIPSQPQDLRTVQLGIDVRLYSPSEPEYSSRNQYFLQYRAFQDQLVRIFSERTAPKIVTYWSPNGKPIPFGLEAALNPSDNDFKISQAHRGDYIIPNYLNPPISKSPNEYMDLEWLTVASMHIPYTGHDHQDLFYPQRGIKSKRIVTRMVHESLKAQGYTIDHLDMWIRCVKASTTDLAIEAMGREFWPPFLLHYTMQRELKHSHLRLLKAIIMEQFGSFSAEDQLICCRLFLRRAHHNNPKYFSALATMFVKIAKEELRRSDVYNDLLYFMFVEVGIKHPKYINFYLEAKDTILADMNKRGFYLQRKGYLALIALLRNVENGYAKELFVTMQQHGYPLGITGQILLKFVEAGPTAIACQYIPKGPNSLLIADVLTCPDFYTALDLFENLPSETTKDVNVWDALLQQVLTTKNMKSSAVFSLWDKMVENGAIPDKYIVEKLMRALNTYQDGMRLLWLARKSSIRMEYRILTQFIHVCHHDTEDPRALDKCEKFLASIRGEDKRSLRALQRIRAYRKWKIRSYLLDGLNSEKPESFEALRESLNPSVKLEFGMTGR
ncbi:uncharacterized protein V1516DRAFT_673144 [Lipomyces oligophaga]|uniref:uncharacterized protein n=1 Tax=Lipomyces oligophaga TaxID=45792 RepID=UPI0034CD144C